MFNDLDDVIEKIDAEREVKRLSECLTQREKDVLHYRYVLEMTYQEIAKIYKITSTRAGQICSKALSKMRAKSKTAKVLVMLPVDGRQFRYELPRASLYELMMAKEMLDEIDGDYWKKHLISKQIKKLQKEEQGNE